MSSVRIGIVGLGLVGRRHVAAVAHTLGVEIAGVVDPDTSGIRFANDHSLPVFSSLESLLMQATPDGVIIATPTPLHVSQAMTCIKNSCPVLVEKPLSTHAEEAAGLVDRAECDGVPLLVGHHRRYNPLIKRASQIIKRGDLGAIRAVQGTCWFYKPDDYFEAAPWRRRKGAGPVSVNLVHDVDLIRYLVGEVVSVRAQAAPSVRGFENEDVAAALLTFANGAIGTITVSDSIVSPWSWEHTAQEYPIYPVTPENCYLIGGEKASLSIPDLRLWTHEGGKQDWWSPISATCQIRESSDPLINQIEHFAAVIKGDAEPLVTGCEGLRTLRVIEAIQQAACSGSAVSMLSVESQSLDLVS